MPYKRNSLLTTVLLLCVLLPLWAHAQLICREPLDNLLDTGLHPYLTDKHFYDQRQSVEQFYQQNQHMLAWFEDGRLSRQGLSLLESMNDLSSADLATRIQHSSTEHSKSRCQLSLYDTALTIGGLRHLQSLLPAQTEPADTLLALSRHPAADQQLRALEPNFPVYHQLQQALKTYQQLAADLEFAIPLPLPDKSIRPDDSYPALKQLSYRLLRLGDLPTDAVVPAQSAVYSGELVTAVRKFQARHGLTSDGVLGSKTFQALNVPMAERVRQIELSLQRWRELPADPRDRMLVVNIPQYKLFAFERGPSSYAQAMEMKVIVGQSKGRHQTPMLTGEMTYIVFSPYWNIPYKILRDEIHPKIIADTNYLAANNYQIVAGFSAHAKVLPASDENIAKLLTGELKLRQSNGKKNALGSAKFMFPNQYDVYLHGTQAKSLFERSKRDFSHGCVRLADPAALAAFILQREQNWTRQRIDKLIHSGKRKVVGLTESLPVYLMYATASVNEAGKVVFAQDIYQLDGSADTKLARVASPARLSPDPSPGG